MTGALVCSDVVFALIGFLATAEAFFYVAKVFLPPFDLDATFTGAAFFLESVFLLFTGVAFFFASAFLTFTSFFFLVIVLVILVLASSFLLLFLIITVFCLA